MAFACCHIEFDSILYCAQVPLRLRLPGSGSGSPGPILEVRRWIAGTVQPRPCSVPPSSTDLPPLLDEAGEYECLTARHGDLSICIPRLNCPDLERGEVQRYRATVTVSRLSDSHSAAAASDADASSSSSRFAAEIASTSALSSSAGTGIHPQLALPSAKEDHSPALPPLAGFGDQDMSSSSSLTMHPNPSPWIAASRSGRTASQSFGISPTSLHTPHVESNSPATPTRNKGRQSSTKRSRSHDSVASKTSRSGTAASDSSALSTAPSVSAKDTTAAATTTTAACMSPEDTTAFANAAVAATSPQKGRQSSSSTTVRRPVRSSRASHDYRQLQQRGIEQDKGRADRETDDDTNDTSEDRQGDDDGDKGGDYVEANETYDKVSTPDTTGETDDYGRPWLACYNCLVDGIKCIPRKDNNGEQCDRCRRNTHRFGRCNFHGLIPKYGEKDQWEKAIVYIGRWNEAARRDGPKMQQPSATWTAWFGRECKDPDWEGEMERLKAINCLPPTLDAEGDVTEEDALEALRWMGWVDGDEEERRELFECLPQLRGFGRWIERAAGVEEEDGNDYGVQRGDVVAARKTTRKSNIKRKSGGGGGGGGASSSGHGGGDQDQGGGQNHTTTTTTPTRPNKRARTTSQHAGSSSISGGGGSSSSNNARTAHLTRGSSPFDYTKWPGRGGQETGQWLKTVGAELEKVLDMGWAIAARRGHGGYATTSRYQKPEFWEKMAAAFEEAEREISDGEESEEEGEGEDEGEEEGEEGEVDGQVGGSGRERRLRGR